MSEPFTDVVESLTEQIARLHVVAPEIIEAEARRERLDRFQREAQFPARARSALAASTWSCHEWTRALELVSSKFGNVGATVLVVGKTRRGKTVLAVAAGLKFIERTVRAVRYIRLLRLMLRFERAQRTEGDSREHVIEEFSEVPLLIIDECGKGFGSEAEMRLVFELIDERHNRFKDTLLVTNQNEEQACEWLGPALVARLNETGGVIVCDWPEITQ